jgi:integrase
MTRQANLGTRTARLKLKPAARHRAKIGADLFLDYRRPRSGPGAWSLRRYVGGKYALEAFGAADDLDEADGLRIFNFHQATAKARELAKAHVEIERLTADGPPLTVARACEEYADAREARWVNGLSGSKRDARNRLARSLPKDLLEAPLARVTVDMLATARPGIDERTVHDLRAAINAAARRYRDRLPPTLRDIIRDGLASPGSAPKAAREVAALTIADVKRFVAAAQEIDGEDQWDGALFRIVLTLASTGNRFSQIARCRVADVQVEQGRLMVPTSRKGKSDSKATHTALPIGEDLIKALKPAIAGRLGNEPLFMRPEWRPIGVGHYEKAAALRPWSSSAEFHRPWRLIAERAGMASATPYSLRHAAIIRSLALGLPTALVAKLFDTSVQMIEKNYADTIVTALDKFAKSMAIPLAPVAPSPIAAVR